jgi:hypothetical protein
MAATKSNIVIEQGVTWVKAWQPQLNGANLIPTPPTNWSVKAQVRGNVADAATLYEWSTVIGNAAISAGVVSLTVTPAISSAWTWRKAVYDVEVSNSVTLESYRIVEGTVTISPEVTR